MGVVLLLAAAAVHAAASERFTPPGRGMSPAVQTVVVGSRRQPEPAVIARFTVLSPFLIRMEQSLDAEFEDRQTYVAWNRAFPATPFTHNTTDGLTTIETSGLVLRYAGGEFSPDSLWITMKEPNWLNVSVWRYGRSSSEGNLFGTFRNLDGLDGWQDMNCSSVVNGALGPDPAAPGAQHDQAPYAHWWCSMGLVSQAGWATVDDSHSPLFADGWLLPQPNGQCPSNTSTDHIDCLGKT
jgi:hypothetical protein